MKWIDMQENPPTEQQEILFIAMPSHTYERVGIACPKTQSVFLQRTDIHFKHIFWWLPIPKDPREELCDLVQKNPLLLPSDPMCVIGQHAQFYIRDPVTGIYPPVESIKNMEK